MLTHFFYFNFFLGGWGFHHLVPLKTYFQEKNFHSNFTAKAAQQCYQFYSISLYSTVHLTSVGKSSVDTFDLCWCGCIYGNTFGVSLKTAVYVLTFVPPGDSFIRVLTTETCSSVHTFDLHQENNYVRCRRWCSQVINLIQ